MLSSILKSATAGKSRPTFVNSGAETASSNGAITLAVPSGVQNGDLLIAFYSGDFSGTWTTLSGWTEAVDTATRPGIGISYRTASSEPSTYTFQSSGGGTNFNGFILAYRGAAFDLVGTLGTGTGTTVAAPSITVTSNNSILLGVYSQGGTGAATFTAPSGMTLVSSVTNSRPIFGIYRQDVESGATGTRTLTSSVSNNLAGILLAIKPS